MQKVSSQEFVSALAGKGRRRRLPQYVAFEVSYGCNLRCLHCYNPTHTALPRELSFDEIRRILAELAEFGVFNVCFTGGEPFLRPRFFELLEHSKRLGLAFSLNTNATRITPEIAGKLDHLAPSDIGVSVYGASETVYEAATGIAGSYRRFIAGLDALSGTDISVILQMPLMKANRAEASAVRELARARGYRFAPSVDISPRQDGASDPLRQRLSPAETAAVLGELGMRGERDSCASNGGFISCDCGKLSFAITPYGEMNLCTMFPIPKYDLRGGSVREGWEILKRTVDQAKPGKNYECPSCDLKDYCRQGRADAFLETGDMSACLPHYERLAELEKELDPERSLA